MSNYLVGRIGNIRVFNGNTLDNYYSNGNTNRDGINKGIFCTTSFLLSSISHNNNCVQKLPFSFHQQWYLVTNNLWIKQWLHEKDNFCMLLYCFKEKEGQKQMRTKLSILHFEKTIIKLK